MTPHQQPGPGDRHRQANQPSTTSSRHQVHNRGPALSKGKPPNNSHDSYRRSSRRSGRTNKSKPKRCQHKPKPPVVDGETLLTTPRRSKQMQRCNGDTAHNKALSASNRQGGRNNTLLTIKSKMTCKRLNSKKFATHKGDKTKMTSAKGEQASATITKAKETNAEEIRQRKVRRRGGAKKLRATGNDMKHENEEIYVKNAQLEIRYLATGKIQQPTWGTRRQQNIENVIKPDNRGTTDENSQRERHNNETQAEHSRGKGMEAIKPTQQGDSPEQKSGQLQQEGEWHGGRGRTCKASTTGTASSTTSPTVGEDTPHP